MKEEHESLKNLLLAEINATEGWLTKGQLYLVAEKEEYSPENAGRRLRELASEKRIQVDYYKGKRNQTLTRYAKIGELKPLPIKPKIIIEEVNGERVARYEKNTA